MWKYYVPYTNDVRGALRQLQAQEFDAGRFEGSEHRPTSIQVALEAARESGTRSILDVFGFSSDTQPGMLAPLSPEAVEDYFGSAVPTREDIEVNHELPEDLDRGTAVYLVAYENGLPKQLAFVGVTFD